MNLKNTKLFYFTICLFVTIIGHSQTYNTITERTKKVIDSTYNSLIKKNKVVGMSIAIVDNGEIVYATGYGFSDNVKKTKADEKTIYRIGSCTKSFTALSILQLQEKGLVNINNSVKTYLPELKITSRFNDDNEIFVKDMMCHVSGLPCDISNGFFCDAPPDINWVINELNKQTTMSPRLYKHAYSNIAFGLLGEVIAREGKTTYSDYVKKNIFMPLNMTSSYIDYDEKLAVNFSKGYYEKKEVKEPLIRDQAAGLIHSNVLDMSNYIKMYLSNGKFNNTQLISSESLNEMEKNQLGSTFLSANKNWGYGLYTKTVLVKKDKDSSVVNIIGHGGDTYAFHADFGFIPELNVGVVLLTNTDNGARINSAEDLLKLYLKEAKSKKIDVNSDPIKNKSESIVNGQDCSENEIIGKYNFGGLLIDVKNSKKIKFKQGPAKVVLIQKKGDTKKYTGKAVLFKIIPIKLKNAEFTFEKLNEAVYLKQIDTKNKKTSYGTIKVIPNAITDSWKNKFGNYTAIGTNYKCTACPVGDNEGMTMNVSEEKGFVLIKTKAKSPDTKNTAYLNIISENMAVTGGIGRGTGETVKILPNGNIYYSGFEFEKIK